MEKNTVGLIAISSKTLPVRIGLGLACIVVFVLVWLAVSWQFGNLLADVTKPTDSNARSIAKMALSLSPRDPLTQWLNATLENDLSVQQFGRFENIVRLSPADYRWWIQLGRAYEQADKPEQAEAAFNYAIDLAPNYVVPRWQAGNFYLRLGREADGFAALKKAAQLDPVYREQVFSVVWDFYEQDPAKLESIAGDNPDVIAGLAKFYAAKREPDKSLEAWKRLSVEERTKNTALAKLVMQAFYESGFYRTSVQFAGELEAEKGASIGRIHNGGFENEILPTDQAFFSWKMVNIENMRVQPNSFKRHKGKRSLELLFRGFEKPVIYNVYQTVAVASGTKYRLSFWYKTDNLASKGMPIVEVANAGDGRVIGASEPIPTGTNDWREMSFEFTIPEDVEGVSLRTNREYCGETCLLNGSLFYDDFQMRQIR